VVLTGITQLLLCLAIGHCEYYWNVMQDSKIKLENIRIEYSNEGTGVKHLAVENVSLDVHENEFLVVVGPSGCGKSTLLSAIAGFLKPVEGRLTMNGKDIDGPGADRGVVFQDYK